MPDRGRRACPARRPAEPWRIHAVATGTLAVELDRLVGAEPDEGDGPTLVLAPERHRVAYGCCGSGPGGPRSCVDRAPMAGARPESSVTKAPRMPSTGRSAHPIGDG
jgi:hypothetical protein